jgi:hypothetical protein
MGVVMRISKEMKRTHESLSFVSPIKNVDIFDTAEGKAAVLDRKDGVTSIVMFIRKIDDTCKKFFLPDAWEHINKVL